VDLVTQTAAAAAAAGASSNNRHKQQRAEASGSWGARGQLSMRTVSAKLETSSCLAAAPSLQFTTGRTDCHAEQVELSLTLCPQAPPFPQPPHSLTHSPPQPHLSMRTVRATSRAFHSSWGCSLSTPLAGPTVMLTVTKRRRSNTSPTMRCRASAVRGAALEYCRQSSTAVQQYSSTAVQQYSSTAVQQYSRVHSQGVSRLPRQPSSTPGSAPNP
jgi:hypothetical protein